jgi:hypothetical protein
MTNGRRRAVAVGCSYAAATAVAALVGAAALAACSSGGSGDQGPSAPVDGSLDSTSSLDGNGSDASGPESGALPDASSDGPFDALLDGAGLDAGDGGDGGCTYGFFGEATDLRCTGLYSDWTDKTVSSDVVEYDPGLHLWSDGAVKTRWIYLPPDGTIDGGRMPIDTSNMDEWMFPVGTKFWKEFVLGGKRIETRLLWKIGDGNWYRTTYAWSADETTATELIAGMLNADGNGYEIPTQTECNTCHDGRIDGVLGFEAVSLASANATPLTVAGLASLGWITDAPDASLAIPGNAGDIAALGYLHSNCGIACHNRDLGEAKGTGFFMRLDVATLASVQSTDTFTTGVNRPTGTFEIPGNTNTYRLAPGDAGASCVFYRMSHRDGIPGPEGAEAGTQMPPIDTHKVDDAGVGIITQWIAQGCQ